MKNDPTEQEIIAAAKAIMVDNLLSNGLPDWKWDEVDARAKWHYISMAYAALRAAREVRKS